MALFGAQSLKDYLKRYESNNEEEKKMKKKKKKVKAEVQGVLVVDEDPIWQKPVKLEEEEDHESADEEKPLVDEDIEVKRMKRLEQLKSRHPYNAIAEDGSGWVSLSSTSTQSVDPDADMSLPYRQGNRNDTPSPELEGKPLDSAREDTDLSSPRQRQGRHYTSSPEPYAKPSHFSEPNSDLSPPRKWRARNDTPSPEPKLKASQEATDFSPLQQPKKHNYSSPEPGAEPKHSSDMHSDLSPPRRQRVQSNRYSPQPEFKPSREDTDLSPPRQQPRQYYTPLPEFDRKHAHFTGQTFDISPPRPPYARGSPGTDLSPPRKGRKDHGRSGSPGRSLQRIRRHSAENGSSLVMGQDLSPPRKKQKESSDPSSSKERPKTGLISGRDIRDEISKTNKDELLRFEQMDPSISGRGAEPIYRDKKGERISKDEYLKSKQKVEEKPKEKKIEWGKGLAQKREAEARLQELELEKEKPFARTRDDPEIDKMLKDRVRWGDPMAHLVKKKHSEPVLPDFGENEKMKESGFIIPQDVPSHSWIKRGLDAAPNRYGIKPGRHWDGVDRSNGFEKQLFKRMNEKQATEREAYLWSVSDM